MSRTKIRRRRPRLRVKRIPYALVPRLVEVTRAVGTRMIKVFHDPGCPAREDADATCTCPHVDVEIEPSPGGHVTAEWVRRALYLEPDDDDDHVKPEAN